MDDRIEAAAEIVRDAETTVALTGAGVSTASGIPDFRSDGGIWDRYDASDFDVHAFERDPGSYWERRIELNDELFADGIEPNPAHEALAALESDGHLDAVVTQNIDGLHSAAGSEEVVPVHGRADRVVCRSCDRRFDVEGPQRRAREGELPPRCRECDGVLKPDTVLFGERLPEQTLARARRLAESSDAFLVAGTSLTVEPAASLPATASRTGATVIVANLDETPRDGLADYLFREDVTEVLPRLRDAVGE